jgi:hypothetical protein
MRSVPTVEANSEIRSLCHQAVSDPNPAHRAEALEQIRDVIRHEYRLAQSPEEKCSLHMAEQIFDFIDETLNSRSDA